MKLESTDRLAFETKTSTTFVDSTDLWSIIQPVGQSVA